MESFVCKVFKPLQYLSIVGGAIFLVALIGFLIYVINKKKIKTENKIEQKDENNLKSSESNSNLIANVFDERTKIETKKREVKKLTKEQDAELNKIVQQGKMKDINKKNFYNDSI